MKASRIMLVNFNTLEEYFAEHKTILSHMLATSFPSIANERTTIKFIIRGFTNNTDVQYLLTDWASQPPATIQHLMSMAISAQSMAHYITSATPIPIIPTQAPNTIRTHHQYEPTRPCAHTTHSPPTREAARHRKTCTTNIRQRYKAEF